MGRGGRREVDSVVQMFVVFVAARMAGRVEYYNICRLTPGARCTLRGWALRDQVWRKEEGNRGKMVR